jgi:hypothetical protein
MVDLEPLEESDAETLKELIHRHYQLTQSAVAWRLLSGWKDTLGLTPEQVITDIKLAGDAEARFKLELLQGQMDTLDEGVQAEITQKIIAGDWQGAMATMTTAMQQHATNNPIKFTATFGNMRYINGAWIPTGPAGTSTSKAAPVSSTRAAGGFVGAGSQTIIVNMPSGANGTEVVNALRRYQRANGPLDRGWVPQ